MGQGSTTAASRISQNVPKPKRPQANVSKPKRPLVYSQSVVSVKAVTIEFYRKIILWSKRLLKLLCEFITLYL